MDPSNHRGLVRLDTDSLELTRRATLVDIFPVGSVDCRRSIQRRDRYLRRRFLGRLGVETPDASQ